MMEKTYYALRLSARLIDLLLTAFVVMIVERLLPQANITIPLAFVLYNVVVIPFNGKTLGKYAFSLSTRSETPRKSVYVPLIVRELLFPIFLPLLFLNFLTISAVPLHDRITGIRVIRDE
ncbi:MAG: hypothetical protein GY866_25960 [Proteobacteria bacterium]|nr:hypothetical protein [Pseudomonadota bacterium]